MFPLQMGFRSRDITVHQAEPVSRRRASKKSSTALHAPFGADGTHVLRHHPPLHLLTILSSLPIKTSLSVFYRHFFVIFTFAVMFFSFLEYKVEVMTVEVQDDSISFYLFRIIQSHTHTLCPPSPSTSSYLLTLFVDSFNSTQ